MELATAKTIVNNILNSIQKEAFKQGIDTASLPDDKITVDRRYKILTVYRNDIEAIQIIKNNFLKDDTSN